MNRITTGIKALDELLQGGFPEGATVLIAGRPGTGKTIMANMIMFHNANPQFKALYLTTMAEPLVKVLKFQQEFDFFQLSKVNDSIIYHDLGSVLQRKGAVHALAFIDNMLKEYEPKMVVIDSMKTLSEMLPSITQFREFMLGLSLRFATWGCTFLMLGEYGEEEIDIRPESAIADGVIYLSGNEERKFQKRYLRILKMRGTDFAGGETVFRLSRAGVEIFSRLNPAVADQSYQQFSERISTGIPGLDALMGGGIPRGTATLLSGATGTGKTLCALNFTRAGLLAGELSVFITLEENPWQIITGFRRMGFDLEPYLAAGQLRLLHFSPIEFDVDRFVSEVQQTVKSSGARRLVIDSITSFEIGMRDKEKYTDFIWAFTDYLKTQGINLYLTHEMQDSGHFTQLTKHGISFVADNLLLLRYLEQGPEMKRFLRVVKMRASSHSTLMYELLISDDGISLKAPA